MTRGLLARWAALASVVYVVAWLLGLAVPGATIDRAASDTAVRDQVVGSGPAVLLQSSLVHGLAGVALLVLLAGAAARIPTVALRRGAVVAGAGAALASLVQAALAAVLVAGASSHPAAWSRAAVSAIDGVDVAKLLLLASAVLLIGRAASGLRGWLRAFSVVVPALLVVGAAGLVMPSPLLDAVLAASLVALLVLAGALGAALGRTAGRDGSAGSVEDVGVAVLAGDGAG